MKKYYGKGACGGIAIGKAKVFRRQQSSIASRISIDDVENELERVSKAKESALSELTALYERALKEVGESEAEIFDVHIMMLDDEDYNDSIHNIIETEKVCAEYAISVTADNFAEMFESMDDEYMQARSADIRDISKRLINCLDGGDINFKDAHYVPDVHGESKTIICADDLTPSETISLEKDSVLAFVTESGSQNSHTAILARSMDIPAVIGAGEGFLNDLCDEDFLVVDGYAGEVYVSPDEETLRKYEERQAEDIEGKRILQELKGKESVTEDGTKVIIAANIGGVEDIESVIVNDADGIGLFRSEFLYLENEESPSEEQQFEAYRKILEEMSGKKVIIRTMDIGADKKVDYLGLEKEDNPALGLRAIRICLSRPELFKSQLRALYRASVYGNLGIMFPMIISVSEVEQCKMLCKEVMDELKQNGIPFDEKTEIGIMIETPAAALISDRLAPLVDFFSIGTNDLTQYTLACDRQNSRLESFAEPHHEAVLRLIELSANNAHKNGIWVGICGELAADLSLTENFLKMGIDELSVSSSFVLPLRKRIRSITLGDGKCG